MLTLEKYHGLGNDFLLCLDTVSVESVQRAAKQLCDRHVGIGADGIIHVSKTENENEFQFVLFNADGSRAEVSGNGLRCVAHALLRAKWSTPGTIRIMTDAGPREATIESPDHEATVEVDMGEAKIESTEVPAIVNAERAWIVDVGNPHLVLEVNQLPDNWTEIGAKLEVSRPGGLNIGFAQRHGEEIQLSVFERGAGITQACGSGATAAAAAFSDNGAQAEQLTIHQAGGSLQLRIVDESWLLTGPSQFVASIEASSDSDRG